MIQKENKKIKLVIIGAGPAGLTASIYASRYAISNIVISKDIGGQASESFKIENFPASAPISGFDWSQKVAEQAKGFGAEIINDNVKSVEKTGDEFKILTEAGREFTSNALLVASGMERRKLKIKGEKELSGKGVAYCATCDGIFFKDKITAVIGGGNSAAVSALYLADIAKKVYLIHRRSNLRAEETWQKKIADNPKIETVFNNSVEEFLGNEKLEKVVLKNEYNGSKELYIDGIFIEIGYVPADGMLEKLNIKKDIRDYIEVASDMSTNIEGIWAAGDITNGSNNFHQIITACSEGAIAANSIHEFLKKG